MTERINERIELIQVFRDNRGTSGRLRVEATGLDVSRDSGDKGSRSRAEEGVATMVSVVTSSPSEFGAASDRFELEGSVMVSVRLASSTGNGVSSDLPVSPGSGVASDRPVPPANCGVGCVRLVLLRVKGVGSERPDSGYGVGSVLPVSRTSARQDDRV